MTRVPVLLLNIVLSLASILMVAAIYAHDLPPVAAQIRSAQQIPNPNGEPPEFAAGKYCTPQGNIVNGQQTAENPCSCHRVTYSKDCEGEAHSRECRQWCHEEKHCACPVMCEMPSPGDDVDCPM